MSLATVLTRLEAARVAIRSAIQAQGVSVPADTGLEAMPDYIDLIEGGDPVYDVPDALTESQWSAVHGNGLIQVNVTELPYNGGQPITALQWTVDGTTWTSFASAGTGSRDITGLTNGTPYPLQLRAVNSVGNGAASDTKTRTPAAPGATVALFHGPAASGDVDLRASDGGTPPMPSGGAADNTFVRIINGITAAQRADLIVPAGWTFRYASYSDYNGLGFAVYTAPGTASSGFWKLNTITDYLVCGVDTQRWSGVSASSPIRSYTEQLAHVGFTISDLNMPTPNADPEEGDGEMSHYFQPQNATAVGTPTAGYTRVVDIGSPNRRSTLVNTDSVAGVGDDSGSDGAATGAISHNASAAWESRCGATIIMRKA